MKNPTCYEDIQVQQQHSISALHIMKSNKTQENLYFLVLRSEKYNKVV